MIVKDNVEIVPLVKRIFRRTYGVAEDELYRNTELRDRIRNAVKKLRESYDKPFCDTNYGNDEIRKAYMIAYYPYYIEPARYVVENFVAPTLNLNSEDNCIDFFAGGPCPETYGIFQALQNIFYDNADITIFDEENGWFPYQKTTWSLCSEIFAEQDVRSYTFAHRRCRIGKDFADDLDFVGRLKKTKIFFLQNYLSHMSDKPESVEKFLNWFSAVTKQTTSAAFFILIDLNYNSAAMVFRRLVDENFLQTNSLKKIAAHIPDDGEPLTIRHGDTLQSLRDNIFDDNDGLNQKKNTNFYFVVLQKI